MSQEENAPTPTPMSTNKTTAVPLKKETVRITLRSNAPGADAPPSTVPLAPRPSPSGPGAPPAPTVPLSPPPRPSVGGAPPAPSAPGAPARPAPPVSPVGSKTIPLGSTPPRPAMPRAAGAPAAGAPAAPPAAGTQPLPRATVKLGAAAAPTAAISSAPIRTAMGDEDDEVDEGPLNIMAIVALVASLAMLFFAFASVDEWPLSNGIAETTADRDAWKKDNILPSFKLPLDHSPFDKKIGAEVTSQYDSVKPVIPDRPSVD